MTKRVLFLLILLFSIARPAFAWQLKGVVTDSLDGEPLPYARIYLENSSYGVVTNLKGEYFLELNNGTHRIVASTLGYQKKVVEITVRNSNQTLNFQLAPEGVSMPDLEIVATKKDPAYEIIAHVVDNKHRYLQQFESFKCNTYLKIILEADSLPPKKSKKDSVRADADSSGVAVADSEATQRKSRSKAESESPAPGGMINARGQKEEKIPGKEKLNFIEQVSETWFRYPHQYKEVVLAMQDYTEKYGAATGGVYVEYDNDYRDGPPSTQPQSHNPYLFVPTVSQSDFNFYRNTLDFPRLGPQPFVSPVSSSGRVYYTYRLEESFFENGQVIHKIKVTPREWEGPMFEGDLYIVDGLWCIKSLNLTVRPGAMNFFNYFQIIHDYEKLDTNWVLKREEYFYNLKEGKRNFYGSTLGLHSEYVLNPEIPGRFFANELRRVEDEAYERDSSWWAETRPVSLKPEEDNFISFQDSMKLVWENADSLYKRDSIYNRITVWDVFLNGVGFYNRAKKRSIYFNSLLQSMQLFSPGGYRQSLGGNFSKEFRKGYVLGVNGDINYGFLNRDLRGQGQVSYTYLPKHFGRFYVGYGNIFSMINNYASFTSFLARGNYVNKIHYSVGQEYEVANGLYVDLEVRRVEYRTISGLKIEKWSEQLFGSANTPPDFDPYEEFQINLKLTFTPFQKYYTEPYRKVIVGSNYPKFTLRYLKSFPGVWGSDLDFDKLELQVTDDFQVGTLGQSNWNVYLGGFLRNDSAMFIDYKFFRGSDPVWFSDPMRSFQLLGPSINTKDFYIQGHYYHNFYGMFFNKIPGIRKLKIQSIAGGGALYIPQSNFFHSEVFAGIQIPFRIKKQIFAFGTYYAVAVSTPMSGTQTFNNQIKIGLNYFDSFRNKWEY